MGSKTATYFFIVTNLPNPIPEGGCIDIIFPETFYVPEEIQFKPLQGLTNASTIGYYPLNTFRIANSYPYSQTRIEFSLKNKPGVDSIIPLTNRSGFIEIRTLAPGGIKTIDYNDHIPLLIYPSKMYSNYQ